MVNCRELGGLSWLHHSMAPEGAGLVETSTVEASEKAARGKYAQSARVTHSLRISRLCAVPPFCSQSIPQGLQLEEPPKPLPRVNLVGD